METKSIFQYYTPVKIILPIKDSKLSANTTNWFQNKPGHYAAFNFTEKQEYWAGNYRQTLCAFKLQSEEKYKNKWSVNQLINSVLMSSDKIGLHIHCWRFNHLMSHCGTKAHTTILVNY